MAATDGIHTIAAAASAAAVQERPKRNVGGTSNHETRAQLEEILQRVRDSLGSAGTQISFSINEDANRVVVRITDSETGELIRQIPSEEMLRISKSIRSLLGLLYDTMA